MLIPGPISALRAEQTPVGPPPRSGAPTPLWPWARGSRSVLSGPPYCQYLPDRTVVKTPNRGCLLHLTSRADPGVRPLVRVLSSWAHQEDTPCLLGIRLARHQLMPSCHPPMSVSCPSVQRESVHRDAPKVLLRRRDTGAHRCSLSRLSMSGLDDALCARRVSGLPFHRDPKPSADSKYLVTLEGRPEQPASRAQREPWLRINRQRFA